MKGKSTPISEGRLLSLQAISTEWGVGRERIRKLLAGVSPAGERNGYPAYAIRDVARVMVADELGITLSGSADPERMNPKDRKDWFDSELKKEKLAEVQGSLIPDEEHREGLAKILLQVKSWALTIPDRLEREVGLDRRQAQAVQLESDKLLADLHAQLIDDAA